MTLVERVSHGKTLNRVEAKEIMNGIVSREFTDSDVGDFLLTLRGRGETVEEILGFAISLREHARQISIKRKDLVDTCGTGGDRGLTFNISTAVAFVTASSGIGVAKHGNRSVSSLSGSADVYEALGLKIESDEKKISSQIDKLGFGFLYAPHFHPAMAVVAPVRKSLGVRTVFNILGPLLNPALVKKQVMGVYNRPTLEKMAQVLRELGSTEALIVSSRDGLDEISVSDTTDAVYLKDGVMAAIEISPKEYGFSSSNLDLLKGGNSQENAKIIEKIFAGKKGPARDVVVFNAAAALWIGGLTKNIKDGIVEVTRLLDKGLVAEYLENLRATR